MLCFIIIILFEFLSKKAPKKEPKKRFKKLRLAKHWQVKKEHHTRSLGKLHFMQLSAPPLWWINAHGEVSVCVCVCVLLVNVKVFLKNLLCNNII